MDMGQPKRNAAALHVLLESVADCFTQDTAKALIALRQEDRVRKTMQSLGKKASVGKLTESEANEYDALIEASDLIASLQLKARRRLTAKAA